jgi:hypothetical protein
MKRTKLRALLCACLLIGAAQAQEDPFGAPPKPATAAAGAATAPTAGESDKPEPLVIQLLRASNPTTPRELMQAAQSALQFGRPDEAKRYLAKLVADKPADEALAALAAPFADFLLQLNSNKELQPEGKQAAELVYSAARQIVENPERIAAAITQLSAAEPRGRQDAIEALQRAGTHVVNPMLRVLADPSRQAEQANVRTALIQLGRTTELPLIAAVDAKDQNLVMQIIAVLGRMRSKRAALHLLPLALDPQSPPPMRQLASAALQQIAGVVPDLYEADKYLRRYADQYLRGDLDYERSTEDTVTLWNWDETQQGVFPHVYPRLDAGLFLAVEIVNDLYRLRPHDDSVRRLKLLTELERAKVLGGLAQPLLVLDKIEDATARDINQVLHDAMRLRRVPAAIAAAELLGQMGDAAVLNSPAGIAGPLAEAMTFSDRRVRFAAVLTTVKLAPGQLFPGAGRVAENLAWFVETSGRDIVLIGHPRGEDAQSLVGFMNALGYEGEGVYIGRDFADRAFANPDYPFLLIAGSIDRPPVLELVQWLRRDYRTARQPIGVMARGERFDSLREAFRDDPYTTVFPRIHSTDIAAIEVEKLKAIAGRNLVGSEERLAQALASLQALARLAKNPATLVEYDLLRHESTVIRALNNPLLSDHAAQLLALFATPRAQAALADLASQSSRPLENREAAAAALAGAVKLRGLRLSQQQVAEQLARYQTAEAAKASGQIVDEPGRDVLAAVVKAIEAPAIARGEWLKQE